MKTKPKKDKVYLSGKVSGLPYWYAWLKFKFFSLFWKAMGYDTWNPIDNVKKNTTWGLAMDICLKGMKECQLVYFMFDFRWSRGSRIEFMAAADKGLVITNFNPWLVEKYYDKEIFKFNRKLKKAML